MKDNGIILYKTDNGIEKLEISLRGTWYAKVSLLLIINNGTSHHTKIQMFFIFDKI